MRQVQLRLRSPAAQACSSSSADSTKLCFLPASAALTLRAVLPPPGRCAFICRPVLMCGRCGGALLTYRQQH